MSLRSDVYNVRVLDCAWYVKKSGGLGQGVVWSERYVWGCPRGVGRMYVSGRVEVVKE